MKKFRAAAIALLAAVVFPGTAFPPSCCLYQQEGCQEIKPSGTRSDFTLAPGSRLGWTLSLPAECRPGGGEWLILVKGEGTHRLDPYLPQCDVLPDGGFAEGPCQTISPLEFMAKVKDEVRGRGLHGWAKLPEYEFDGACLPAPELFLSVNDWTAADEIIQVIGELLNVHDLSDTVGLRVSGATAQWCD